jgi:Tfp pilus assembly protein PilF
MKSEAASLPAPLDRLRLLKVTCVTLIVSVPIGVMMLKPQPPEVVVASAALTASSFQEDVNLARTLISSGKARESLAPLERALKARPDAFVVHNNRCVAFGMLLKRDEAVAACRRALEIEPKNALGQRNMAWVQSISH